MECDGWQVLSFDVPAIIDGPTNIPSTGGLLSLAGRNFGTQSYSGATRTVADSDAAGSGASVSGVSGGE
jgi:hypothetical protein